MSTIYILQKEVPSLGLLIKVGMTTRDGEDRAKEYGGGGWQIVRQFTTKMDTTATLRDLEHRIHQRLEDYRCDAAKEFGLSEVFTCTAAHAIAVAADEIGADPAGDDRVERLRKSTNRGVVRKIMQQHQSALAKFHIKAYRNDWELRKIHADSLRALDNCGDDDPTFRAMLRRELKELEDREKKKSREAEDERTRKAIEEGKAAAKAARDAEKARIYEAGRALEAAKVELKIPAEDARRKLVSLKWSRTLSGVAVFFLFALGLFGSDTGEFAPYLTLLGIAMMFVWYYLRKEVLQLEQKLNTLAEADSNHRKLLSR